MDLPPYLADVLNAVSDGVYFVDRELRVTFWNEAAERLSGYSREEVLGRPCSDGFLCHVDEQGERLCRGGCAFRAPLEEGRPVEVRAWLRHAFGHRVPVRIRAAPLRDEEGAVSGAMQVFAPVNERSGRGVQMKELEEMAYVDPVTGIGNRRWGERMIRARLSEPDGAGCSLGLLFLDLDDFKSVNDQFGHEAGDRALRIAAKTLSGNLRPGDVCCRWGGEEFLVLASSVDRAGLEVLADRLRGLIRASAFRELGEDLALTVSIGAVLAGEGEGPEELVARADERMYLAKRAGGDRVCW